MRKLVICAIALAMVGCKSEYEKSEVSVRPDGDGRLVHTVDGDVISGTVVSKASDGTLKSRVVVKNGVLHGEAIENRNGNPYKVSNFTDGRLTGIYEQFCDDGKHEIKRNITSWPDSYSEETFSCETGNQLIKKNLVDKKPVGEQIVWIEADGQQIMQSKLHYNDKGEFHGEAAWFNRDGSPSKLANYQNGVLHGEYEEYYLQGNLSDQGLYKDGKKIGKWLDGDSWRLAGEGSVNPDDVKAQVLSSLGVDPRFPSHNLGSGADRPYRADLEKAQFYVDQGKVDFKKPYSFNSALEHLLNSREGQVLYKFIPITNLVHENTLDWVLERGGDVNSMDYQGKNRLMACITNFSHAGCSLAHVNKLLELTDINAKDIDGRTILHMACISTSGDSKKRADLRKVLVDKGQVNEQDKYGWTPLHYCLSNGLIDDARTLIARGADVAIKTKNEVTSAQMVWLSTNPGVHERYEATWDKARQELATELRKAGKFSYHTELPAFKATIRDLAMRNGNVELVQHIDMVEPM